MPVVPISQHAILVQAYNPLLAFILALFFALSIRSFILLFAGKNRGVLLTANRLLAGIVFLLLGWLYALFVSPLLIWDRPARATGAVTFVAVLLWTAARSAGSRAAKSPGLLSVTLKLFLFAMLLFTATLTIIRTGYIALVGDRVTLLVDVTGETRSGPPSGSSFPGQTPKQPLIMHHVLISLPTGEKAADTWIFGDSFAVSGRAIRFSPTLRAVDVPNLYALLYAHNGYLSVERQTAHPLQTIPFPGNGSLAVHPWWGLYQTPLLNYWASHSSPGSWSAIQMEENESPYYPLVDVSGKPVQNKFLLVLRPNAIPTSRGSSPLEPKEVSRR